MPSHRRTAITVEQRVAIREKHRSEPSLSQQALCNWFNQQYRAAGPYLNRSQISQCLSKKYAHLDDPGLAYRPKQSRGRVAQYEELDKALHDWQLRMQAKKLPVSDDLIKESARRLWQNMECYSGKEMPAFSNGWLQGFKMRWNIKKRAHHGEAGAVDTAALAAERQRMEDLVRQYPGCNVYNMDETGLFWKTLPSSSLATTPLAGRKHEKARITAILTCNADGTDKMKIWLVGKADTPMAFRRAKVAKQSLPCYWRANKTAWNNTNLMLEWFRAFEQHVAPRNVLLLMDNFSAHEAALRVLQEETGNEQPLPHVHIEFLPANSTALYQPLDQGIIACWKLHWRKRWLRYVLDQEAEDKDPLKTMTVLLTLRWAADAWDDVAPATVANCWRHSTLQGPAFGPMNEEQARALRVAADKEVAILKEVEQQVQRIVPNPDYRMRIEFFLNGQDQEAVDDDPDELLLQAAQLYGSVQQEEEEEGEEAEEEPLIAVRQALEAVQLLTTFEQQQEQCNEAFATLLRKRQRQLLEFAEGQKQQARVTDFFNFGTPLRSPQ